MDKNRAEETGRMMEVGETRAESDDLAELVSLMEEKGETAQDVLQSEALAYNEYRDKLLAGMQEHTAKVGALEVALREDSPFLYLISDDEKVLTLAMKAGMSRRAVEVATPRLRSSNSFITNALLNLKGGLGDRDNSAGIILEHASEELRDNEAIVNAAVRLCPKAIALASERFKNDMDFVLRVARRDPSILKPGAAWNWLNGPIPYIGAELRDKIMLKHARSQLKTE